MISMSLTTSNGQTIYKSKAEEIHNAKEAILRYRTANVTRWSSDRISHATDLCNRMYAAIKGKKPSHPAAVVLGYDDLVLIAQACEGQLIGYSATVAAAGADITDQPKRKETEVTREDVEQAEAAFAEYD